jgi:hypothetical protein
LFCLSGTNGTNGIFKKISAVCAENAAQTKHFFSRNRKLADFIVEIFVLNTEK